MFVWGAKLGGVYNLNKSEDRNLWETPPELYLNACNYFGVSPLLDVCATPDTSKCKWHYNEGALDKPFNYDFFCNPPYSQMKKWVRKCYLEHVRHNVDGLLLIFAKTDTRAFHDYIFGGKAEIWFLQGRVHFYQNGIPSKNPAPFGSAFICYRKKI